VGREKRVKERRKESKKKKESNERNEKEEEIPNERRKERQKKNTRKERANNTRKRTGRILQISAVNRHRAVLEAVDLRTLAVVLVLAREAHVGEAVEHLGETLRREKREKKQMNECHKKRIITIDGEKAPYLCGLREHGLDRAASGELAMLGQFLLKKKRDV